MKRRARAQNENIMNTMSASVENVFIEALSLPARARAELANRLMISLEEEETSPEIETAWKNELRDRLKAYEEGKMPTRSSADVMREAYKKVK